MTHTPPIVKLSLGAIAVTGSYLAMMATVGGGPLIGALFLLLPVGAWATWRTKRGARSMLITCALVATLPLQMGAMLTWPHLDDAVAEIAGLVAIVGGVAGMLSHAARHWYASARAHRVVGL